MDAETVRRYCQHIDIALDDYETLLMGKPSADLLATEMFKDYKTDFDNTNDIKKLKEAKQFKAKTEPTKNRTRKTVFEILARHRTTKTILFHLG